MAFICLIALTTGMYSKVYLVFDNHHLMKKDQADFERLWVSSGLTEQIQYCVGYDFQPEEGALILVDESDTGMLDSPDVFAKLVHNNVAICLTGTPGNSDEAGVESEVTKAMQFKLQNYFHDEPEIPIATQLRCDEVVKAESITEKVSYIISLVSLGTVLVHATEELYNALKLAFEDTVLLEETMDHLSLR